LDVIFTNAPIGSTPDHDNRSFALARLCAF
jgi:hypothetical protein